MRQNRSRACGCTASAAPCAGGADAAAVTLVLEDGTNEADLQATKLARDIAVAQYEKAIQTAFREVADTLASRAALMEQCRATLAQVEAAQATYKLSELRDNNGVSSYLDLLDAQRSWFAVQTAALQLHLAQLQNQVSLYKALGGGWTENATDTAAR